MDNCPTLSLLVVNGDVNSTNALYFEKIQDKYEITSNKELIADIVLDLAGLKLYHHYNNQLITTLNTLNEIIVILSTDIINQIKKTDFDVDFCLSMLGGSKEVFKSLCINYLAEYKDVNEKIKSLFKNKDFDSLAKVLHKIKGVTFYVGGEKFYKITCLIETKVLMGNILINDIEYFTKYHGRILNYLLEVVS